jgi:hypothetical protein
MCHRKACFLETAWSPKSYWSFSCVVVAFSPSLTQKDGIPLREIRCFLFHDKVYNRPDMSSTFSTLRHCKAMQLQVGMKEGQRSVLAVCSIASTARRNLHYFFCHTS